ncbi:phosphoribosylglycinamide formyltransferase [Inquilinus limosus]|uniref:Phosphoribosylglycinamide formyltransferase n=1 Tax=Inquilinus limosus MP06 TaxID=1398085 RepID=A0A0A0D2Z6_9PROT|nr:phosphoribosylglycinamide formyltransferase [Inquilinus limosus]KGM32365.1 phosphoribosylglycinamide formyltransferase [Inquilinus limosus MP06]
MSTVLRLGFLASHGGTSMRAIIGAIADGTLAGKACLAVSNNRDAPALRFAEAAGVPHRHISATSEGGEAAADLALCRVMQEAGAEWLVLSGYLRKIGPATLDRYRGRLLNIHPALLPEFGGRGLYGRHVHAAVLAAGRSVSGMTVHIVDDEYDHGPVVAQREVPVLSGDTVETLQQRIAEAEPAFFVEVLQSIATGELIPRPN